MFDAAIPAERPTDAHDILGTFEVVSDLSEMRRTPASADQLLDLLASRHRTMLGRRPEIEPGVFERAPNRAGDTVFVSPELVEGTLRMGFEIHAALDPGLPRAIFMMFLAATIIIPTVFRDDYLRALEALTQRHRAAPLVAALTRAAAFSHLDFADDPRILAELERRKWFREPDEARVLVDAAPGP